jgi:hypothetical protein
VHRLCVTSLPIHASKRVLQSKAKQDNGRCCPDLSMAYKTRKEMDGRRQAQPRGEPCVVCIGGTRRRVRRRRGFRDEMQGLPDAFVMDSGEPIERQHCERSRLVDHHQPCSGIQYRLSIISSPFPGQVHT